MAMTPSREFGKRKLVVAQAAAAPPVKRSGHVALLLMGTFAIGGGAYALTRDNCVPKSPGMAAPSLPQTSTACSSGGSSSGGGHGGYWSRRSSFFGGDSASSGSSSGTASESGGVTRGGFGSFARSFSSHFSFGG